MKNTVKLEQFKEVTESELQEIRGGDWRISETILNLIFPRRK
ncbi:competence-stimulating peptide ComC [Streptococcus oralis]|uniref:Competence-stimulating peptide / CSP n=1 Tax=Streptococcus oralis TaxID=1303 RepID=A0A139QYR7_STROR|nr:competence-stimulating peptide ComC [Streptococcus oralis]KXU07565.1 competence-stimulating peptide / CSP [Streptococcus oralis]